METITTNGFSVDDAVAFLNNNNAYHSPPARYQKNLNTTSELTDLEHSSMAPRIDPFPLSCLPCTATDSSSATKPAQSPSPMSSPRLHLKFDVGNPKPVASHPSLFDPDPHKITVESAGNDLRQLSKRCRLAEKRAHRILSRINTVAFRRAPPEVPVDEKYQSDATESSSDDEAAKESHPSLDTWFEKRAILRSHWSLLQSNASTASKCLENLEPLRTRCKKLRKSLPLLAQGGLIEQQSEATSREIPLEKEDASRHSLYDLAKVSRQDYKFPGGAPPACIKHPHCSQTLAPGCICCCPTFDRKQSSVRPSLSVVTRRSLAVDTPRGDEHPHPNTESAKPDTVRSYHGSCSSSTSSQDGYDPRRHSTLFRPPSHPYSNYTRQSNNNGTSNHHKYGSDFVSSSLYQRRKMNHRYEKPEPHKEISVPQWRKLPYPSPFDYARRLEGNCSPPRFHLISPPNSANQSTCNYTVSILDGDQQEDTTDEYYERLHSIEEIYEHRRKLGYIAPLPALSQLPTTPHPPPGTS